MKKICLALALWMAALASAAGEIVLYEHGKFEGRSVTLRGGVADLSLIAMRNVVSSVVAVDSVWELCTEANHRGICRTYVSGRYPDLRELNDRFGSVRELAVPTAPSVGGSYAGAQAGRVDPARTVDLILFEHANFEGVAKTLVGAVDDFAPIGFNDRVSSLIILRGSWQLCTDAKFQGECRNFEAGEYRSVDPAHNDKYSSARPMVVPTPSTSLFPPHSPTTNTGVAVTLYEYADFIGRSVQLSGMVNDLSSMRFNDRASSMVIESGAWEFCTDADFRGECRVFSVGRYANLPKGFESKITSVRQR